MKKFLSIILVSIFLFTSLSFEINAQTRNNEYNSHEAELLYSLGVFDTPELSGENVTRAQFVRYAMKLAGIPVTPYKGTEFNDVPATHVDYGYIMSAVDFGLISIADNFRPEDTIAPSEAIKIIVHLLGYDFIAASKGGYPAGYLQTAQTVELSDGINISASVMTDNEVSLLLYNALKVYLPEVSYGGDGNDYYIGTATILQKYRGILEVNGIVDGVSYYSDYDVNGLGEGKISINNTIYNTGSLNCDTLFGYDVVAYYDTKAKCLISCTPSDSNKIVSVYAEDIESFDSGTFVYADKDSRSKRISIDYDTTIFYNGRLFNYSNLKLLPESGSLTFVSPNGSGTYSTLYIKSYKTIVVSRTSMADNYYIADKYSSSDAMVINPDETELMITDQDGNEMTFSDIIAGDVVNVAISDDEKFVEIICVKDEFLGVYTGYSEDYIEVNGAEYRLTPNLQGKVSDIINPGKYAIFKFDIEQRIADIIPSESSGEHIGYLVIGRTFKNGLSSGFSVRIMDLEGIIHDYEFSEKFSINGKNYSDYALAYNEHKSSEYNSLLCGIVKYTITDEGKLKSLVYSDKDGGNGGLYYTNSLIDNSIGKKFNRWYNNIGNAIVCDTNMVIIKVPNPIYSVDSVDDDLYSIETWELISADGSSKGYTLSGYTTNPDDGMTKYLIMQAIDDQSSASTAPVVPEYSYMVGSIRKTVVDEEPRESMILYGNADPITVYSKNENDFSNAGISGGDIVRINVTEKNIVRSVECVWKKGDAKLGNEDVIWSSNISSRSSAWGIYMGYVYSFRTDVMDVAKYDVLPGDLDESVVVPLYLPQSKIYKYDERLKTVVEITKDEIKDYKYFGDNKTTVIYTTRNEALLNVFVIE